MPSLPNRRGHRPRTSTSLPHRQLDQQPPDDGLSQRAIRAARSWPHVRMEPSAISVEGACAVVLSDAAPAGAPEALIVGREFAHVHAGGDASLHVTLPLDLATEAISCGWAEPHYLVASGQVQPNLVMLYAPRDAAETDVVTALLRASYDFATTQRPVRRSS